ncbi:hypothetical protein, partial [Salmonella sp. hn-h2]|uniref:hypothetical protein n=1 Tax=Salmonella sp. hn-h2 TaxID=2582611 RepID=UPI001F34023E
DIHFKKPEKSFLICNKSIKTWKIFLVAYVWAFKKSPSYKNCKFFVFSEKCTTVSVAMIFILKNLKKVFQYATNQ